MNLCSKNELNIKKDKGIKDGTVERLQFREAR